MNNYSKKNFFFIFLFLIFFIFVGMFNYFYDPYSIFKKNVCSVQLNNLPHKMIYHFYKLHKDSLCKNLVVGTSEIFNLFGFFPSEKLQYVYSDLPLSLNNLLTAYLDLHSEVEHVTLVFSAVYPFQHSNSFENLYIQGQKEMNIRDWYLVLYSKEVINKIIFDLIHKHFKKNSNSFRENILITKPHHFISLQEQEKNNKYITKEQYLNLCNKLIKTVKQKNINCTIVIPPIHTIYYGVLYKNAKDVYNSINDLKRWLVKQVPFIYDFSLITKHSSLSLWDINNIYWADFSHCTEYLSEKYKNIFLGEQADDNLDYFILTEDNIEKKLQKEELLLLDYIKNNQEIMSYYEQISIEKGSSFDINYSLLKKIKGD